MSVFFDSLIDWSLILTGFCASFYVVAWLVGPLAVRFVRGLEVTDQAERERAATEMYQIIRGGR